MARIDHLCFVVHPQNIKRYVQQLEELLEIEFEHKHGPTVSGRDIDSYLCWDAGLELVAPLGSDSETAAALTASLDREGEGPNGVIIGVADLEAAASRARELGYDVGPLVQNQDATTRRAELRAYTTKVEDIREVLVGEFLGVPLFLAEVAYARPRELP